MCLEPQVFPLAHLRAPTDIQIAFGRDKFHQLNYRTGHYLISRDLSRAVIKFGMRMKGRNGPRDPTENFIDRQVRFSIVVKNLKCADDFS